MKKIILIFFILSLIGCEKKKYEQKRIRLPKETKIGRGMFACFIDESTYISKRQNRVTYNQTTGYLFLESYTDSFEFRLFVYENLFEEGMYSFSDTGEEWVKGNYKKVYGLKNEGINQLEITKLNLKRKIISGRFNIDLMSKIGEELEIRDGRFDLKMNIIN